MTPVDACLASGFYCTEANEELSLRRNHRYFAQVQGQMAVGERAWCDFVIYTTHGLSVQTIPFDQDTILLPKLTTFTGIVLLRKLSVLFMYMVFQCAIYQRCDYFDFDHPRSCAHCVGQNACAGNLLINTSSGRRHATVVRLRIGPFI